jgi:YD repeat-containing protein
VTITAPCGQSDDTYAAGSNRLTGINDAAGKQHNWDAFSSSFDYDANGNLTAMTGNPSISNIAYDHRNLSVHTWLAGNVEQIANYNADGQRIIKEV